MTTDKDGNEIHKGMSVWSGGYHWVVGYACKHLIRLDRHGKHGKESRYLGGNRFCLVDIEGWKIPLVFR